MRLVNQINLNHLKIFEAVYRSKNMTKAANELHLTQSGISQHIKTLEENLGLTLFDREKHKLIPTSNANALYEKCARGLNELERTLREMCASSKEVVGHVSIGMPSEFGLNVIVPLVNQLLIDHPQIQVEYSFGLGSKISDLVLNGEIDFAFMDGFSVDRRFSSEVVFEESHELCGSIDYLKKFAKPQNSLQYYEKLRYVDYMKTAPIAQMWLRHHLNLDSESPLKLETIAVSPIVRSIYKMIQDGLGVGILPHHFIEHLPKQEKSRLYLFEGSNNPLKHAISMIHLPIRTQSRATDIFMAKLKEKLKKMTTNQKA